MADQTGPFASPEFCHGTQETNPDQGKPKVLFDALGWWSRVREEVEALWGLHRLSVDAEA